MAIVKEQHCHPIRHGYIILDDRGTEAVGQDGLGGLGGEMGVWLLQSGH